MEAAYQSKSIRTIKEGGLHGGLKKVQKAFSKIKGSG
jgi:hypothetical protein